MPERLQTAGRTIDVAELLAEVGELTLGEVSVRLGLSKPGAHRALATLCHAGWVERARDGRYRAGLGMWRNGAMALEQHPVRRVAAPALERLAGDVSETVTLGFYRDREVWILDRISVLRPGEPLLAGAPRSPAHVTASGKVALAYVAGALENVIAGGLLPSTPRSIIDVEELRREVAAVSTKGYAVNRLEGTLDGGGVAAGIFGPDGEYVASLGVACPASRFTEAWENEVGTRVRASALAISSSLGYREPAGHLRSLP